MQFLDIDPISWFQSFYEIAKKTTELCCGLIFIVGIVSVIVLMLYLKKKKKR